MSVFGDEIGQRRVRLGMSQSAMARALGVRLGRYEGWEQGRHRPTWAVQEEVFSVIEDMELRRLLELAAEFRVRIVPVDSASPLCPCSQEGVQRPCAYMGLEGLSQQCAEVTSPPLMPSEH